MDTKKCRFWSYLVIGLMVGTGCTAQSGCSNNMISGLSSCITYLRGNSTRPLPACCTSLANIQQSQPECICPMLSNNGASATLGIAINRTLAMAMPATCKLTTPHCDGTCRSRNGSSAYNNHLQPYILYILIFTCCLRNESFFYNQTRIIIIYNILYILIFTFSLYEGFLA